AAKNPDGAGGDVTAPDIRPGQNGILAISLPSRWKDYDILSLTAKDPSGRELYTYTFPISRPAVVAARMVDTTGSTPAAVSQTDSLYTLTAAGITASFGSKTGLLR